MELIDKAKCKNCLHVLKEGDKFYCTFRKKGKMLSEDGERKDVEDISNYEETGENEACSYFEEPDHKGILREIYLNTIDCLKRYSDLRNEYYPIVAIWIMGTYLHKQFNSYPFLFLNAMKGSGKTRLLKLIAYLTGGEVQSNLTEAVLFRENTTLGLDEFEGVTRAGGENLRELLNASYKKGSKVKRMRKKRTPEGEQQVVEEFDVYRPIVMANIWGMENVLGDRCITIILERSSNANITRLMEIFEQDKLTTLTKNLFSKGKCSLCSVVTPQNIYTDWNEYVISNYTTTHTNNYTNYTHLFERIKDSPIDGRNLELSLPLFIIAQAIGDDVLDNLLKIIINIVKDKQMDEFTDNYDVLLTDFISQEVELDYFVSINELVKNFKGFLGNTDDWLNNKWFGRALKRLNLVKEKKRSNRGVEVKLDYQKAKDKIRMFR